MFGECNFMINNSVGYEKAKRILYGRTCIMAYEEYLMLKKNIGVISDATAQVLFEKMD